VLQNPYKRAGLEAKQIQWAADSLLFCFAFPVFHVFFLFARFGSSLPNFGSWGLFFLFREEIQASVVE
jgi:hypothetical protein